MTTTTVEAVGSSSGKNGTSLVEFLTQNRPILHRLAAVHNMRKTRTTGPQQRAMGKAVFRPYSNIGGLELVNVEWRMEGVGGGGAVRFRKMVLSPYVLKTPRRVMTNVVAVDDDDGNKLSSSSSRCSF